MAVEAASMVEAVPTAVEDFTEVVGSTVAADSEAEWDSAAAVGFVAARSAEEWTFAEGQDFAVERSAAAFVVTASAAAGAGADGVGEEEVGVGEVGIGTIGGGASVLAGAGLMDIGPDMRIRTDITTLGGRRPTTAFLLMIPTMILTILTTILLLTRIGLTRIDIGIAGTRIRHRRALQ
jgi:hypothetical protein